MSKKTAGWFLGFLGITFTAVVIYLAFVTQLSFTYIFGVFVGISIGVCMILLQMHHENQRTSDQKEQGWQWIIYTPVISATLGGLIKTLGTPEFQIFVLVTISSWLAVFLLWLILRFPLPQHTEDELGYKSYLTPKPEETWRAAKEKYDREQAEWKERQRHK